MLIPIPSSRDPFLQMRGLIRQMDEVFRRGVAPEAWPAVELRDTGEELVLQADVPGMTDEDISIEATAQGLTIRGKRTIEPPEGYTAHRTERSSLELVRSLSWPARIDLDAVRASVKDGVLTVRATKAPEARPKQIAIKAS